MSERKCCGTCAYYASFESVCCNADSENVADFTNEDFQCEQHEYVKIETVDYLPTVSRNIAIALWNFTFLPTQFYDR